MPTHTVEQVATTALVSLVLAGDTIGELATVIREQFTDLDRTGGFHFGKEIDTVSLGLIGDHNEHPAGIGVDGGERISPERSHSPLVLIMYWCSL